MTKPPLKLVPADELRPKPARPLGTHGAALWARIMHEYRIEDAGGLEMLLLACGELDSAETFRAQIDLDGPVIQARGGVLKEHPLIKSELAARAFIVRTLHRLGLDVEPIRSTIGRPPKAY